MLILPKRFWFRHCEKLTTESTLSVCTAYMSGILYHIFYSMTEILSCHMELATNTSAMRQFSNMMLCPSIDEETVRNVVIVCLTLAYTAETHSYLVEAGLVESFLAKPNTTRLVWLGNEGDNILYQ